MSESACTPSDRFEAAAVYLSNFPALSRVSNDVKLELYALFKCITVSKNPQTPRPSLFDFTGRAKWDAWDKLGKQSDRPQPGIWEQRYLEIAQSLGWHESGQGDPTDNTQATAPDGEAGEDRSQGGMGASVSTIPQPPPDPNDQGTLHAFALSEDAQGLSSFLDAQPRTNIDTLDDYGYTPLHLAADRGNTSIVKMLLDRGADVDKQDPDGLTALELAEVGGQGGVLEIIRGHRAS